MSDKNFNQTHEKELANGENSRVPIEKDRGREAGEIVVQKHFGMVAKRG